MPRAGEKLEPSTTSMTARPVAPAGTVISSIAATSVMLAMPAMKPSIPPAPDAIAALMAANSVESILGAAPLRNATRLFRAACWSAGLVMNDKSKPVTSLSMRAAALAYVRAPVARAVLKVPMALVALAICSKQSRFFLIRYYVR